MSLVVLDSSFLIAYHNADDAHHRAARDGMETILDGEWGEAQLLEYVFLEVVTVLRLHVGHTDAVRVGQVLLRAREVEFIPCTEHFLEAFRTFREDADRALSFVDAAIVAWARRHPPGRVATFDTDFRELPGVTAVP